MWTPILGPNERAGRACEKDSDGVTLLREFCLNSCNVWFIRFHLNSELTHVCIGNQLGMTKVMQLDDSNCAGDGAAAKDNKSIRLHHHSCTSTIRMACFSPQSDVVVTVCDNGSVWCYGIDLPVVN